MAGRDISCAACAHWPTQDGYQQVEWACTGNHCLAFSSAMESTTGCPFFCTGPEFSCGEYQCQENPSEPVS